MNKRCIGSAQKRLKSLQSFLKTNAGKKSTKILTEDFYRMQCNTATTIPSKKNKRKTSTDEKLKEEEHENAINDCEEEVPNEESMEMDWEPIIEENSKDDVFNSYEANKHVPDESDDDGDLVLLVTCETREEPNLPLRDSSNDPIAKRSLSVKEKNNENDKRDTELPLYCVLDTNILIHHIKFFYDLLKVPTFKVRIPYGVVKELDGLKLNSEENIKINARRANRVLLEELEKKTIEAQTSTEDVCKFIDIKNCDDSILNACIQLTCKTSTDNIVLISEDINLRLKALASKVMAYNKNDFIQNFAYEFAAIRK